MRGISTETILSSYFTYTERRAVVLDIVKETHYYVSRVHLLYCILKDNIRLETTNSDVDSFLIDTFLIDTDDGSCTRYLGKEKYGLIHSIRVNRMVPYNRLT